MGRNKTYASTADRVAAYRERKKIEEMKRLREQEESERSLKEKHNKEYEYLFDTIAKSIEGIKGAVELKMAINGYSTSLKNEYHRLRKGLHY